MSRHHLCKGCSKAVTYLYQFLRMDISGDGFVCCDNMRTSTNIYGKLLLVMSFTNTLRNTALSITTYELSIITNESMKCFPTTMTNYCLLQRLM